MRMIIIHDKLGKYKIIFYKIQLTAYLNDMFITHDTNGCDKTDGYAIIQSKY